MVKNNNKRNLNNISDILKAFINKNNYLSHLSIY